MRLSQCKSKAIPVFKPRHCSFGQRLGIGGVRHIGTEPLVRVMVEAKEAAEATAVAEDLAREVLKESAPLGNQGVS